MEAVFTISLEDLVTKPAKMAESAVGKLAKQLEHFGGTLDENFGLIHQEHDALGRFTGKVSPLKEAFAAIGGAAEKITGAVVYVTEAFAGAVIEGAKLAIEMGELREKTEASFQAFGMTEEQSSKFVDRLDDMRSALGMTRSELAPMAQRFFAMGQSVDQVEESLRAAASIKAVGIAGGVEVYTRITSKLAAGAKISSRELFSLYKTGVNVGDVAKKMGMSLEQLQSGFKHGTVNAEKFGHSLTDAVIERGAKPLERQAENLSNSWAIFKENIGKLFEKGVDAAKPFLEAMKSLLGIIDDSNPSGQVLHATMTHLFGGMFKLLGVIIPKVERFFLYIILYGLKAYNTIWKPLSHHMGIVHAALVGLGVIVGAFGGLAVAALIPVVGTMFTLAVAVLAATWPLIAIGAAIGLLAGLLFYFRKEIGQALEWLEKLAVAGWEIAKSFIGGLVGGIAKGATEAVEAVKHLGNEVLSGLKSVLGIHSRSAEMFKLGKYSGQGFAGGMGAANDNVQGSAMNLSVAAKSGAAEGGGAGASSTSSVTIHVHPGAVVVSGASGGLADQLEQGLTLMLEKIALQQGLGTAA